MGIFVLLKQLLVKALDKTLKNLYKLVSCLKIASSAKLRVLLLSLVYLYYIHDIQKQLLYHSERILMVPKR